MRKRCSKCKKLKSEIDFTWKVKGKRRHPICKDCFRVYRIAHYQKHKKKYLKKANLWRKRYRIEMHKQMINFLSTKSCVDCGEKDPVVLDFDHVRGKKEQCIGDMLRHSSRWENILMEIAKCEIRCSNCHRKKTAKQFGWYKLRKGD